MSLEADAQSTTDETNSCSSSSLEEVVNLVKVIALNQQENGEKIDKIASGSGVSGTADPSKQALVSALVSESPQHTLYSHTDHEYAWFTPLCPTQVGGALQP